MTAPALGVMNSTLPDLNPADFTYAAADAGYQFVSLRIAKDMNVKATVEALRSTGLSVVDLEFATFTAKTRREHWEWMLDVATALGASYLNAGCKHPDFTLFTHQVGELAEAAHQAGIQILLEPIKFYSDADYAAMSQLATELPATGILLDALQLYRFAVTVGDSAEDVRQKALVTAAQVVKQTKVFQLCDMAVVHSEDEEFYEHEARFARPLPGTGIVDIRALVELVPDAPISIESPNAELVYEMGVEGYLRALRKASRDTLLSSEY